jgi:hypothetical protein
MVHLRDELRLALESLLELGGQVRRGDELDRDVAVEQRIAGAVDDAHAAAADLVGDFVPVGEARTDQRGGRQSAVSLPDSRDDPTWNSI